MAKKLELFDEVGYVWVDDDESNKIHLEDYVDEETLCSTIRVSSQFTFILIFTLSGKANASTRGSNIHTLKGLKERETQQSLQELEKFYSKIGEVVKDSLKDQPVSAGNTIIQLPPNQKIGGPALIPFHELARIKNMKISQKETSELLKKVAETDIKINEIVRLLRGGFGVGAAVSGVQQIKKLWDFGTHFINEREKEKEKQANKQTSDILEILKSLSPLVIALLVLAKLFPSIGETLPEPIRQSILFLPKKKSFFPGFLRKTLDFSTPVPYVVIGATTVGVLVYIQRYKPESTVATILSKMIDSTNKNLLGFSTMAQNLFEDNLKSFKVMQATTNDQKDSYIKDLKNKNSSLEKDNLKVREKFHELKLDEVKTKHLLQDCSQKNSNYEQLIGQQKTYFREIKNNQQQQMITPPNPTPMLEGEVKKIPLEGEITSS